VQTGEEQTAMDAMDAKGAKDTPRSASPRYVSPRAMLVCHPERQRGIFSNNPVACSATSIVQKIPRCRSG